MDAEDSVIVAFSIIGAGLIMLATAIIILAN